MKKFSFQDLMIKLSVIPGFTFLNRWAAEIRSTQTRAKQRVGDLKAYHDIARGGISDVAGSVSGEEDGELEDGEYYEDDEHYEDGEYYEDDEYREDESDYY